MCDLIKKNKEMSDNISNLKYILGELQKEDDGNVIYICDDCVAYMRKLYETSGLEPAVGDMVNAHFKGNKSNEQMWVEITHIEGDVFRGLLKNHPEILNMVYDQEVEFQEKDILMCMPQDWSDERKNQYIIQTHKALTDQHREDHTP